MKQELDLKQLYAMLDEQVDAGTKWPADTVFEMMLGAILVQNTTWHNTALSLTRLGAATDFNPEVIAHLTTEELKPLIYSSGFHKRKTQLILDCFGWLKKYAFEKPVFVADTYALKLFRHLGSPYSTDYLTLKNYVEGTATFTLTEWQKFHGLIDEYGKVYLRGKQETGHPHWEGFVLV